MNNYDLIRNELYKISNLPKSESDFEIIAEKLKFLIKEFMASLNIFKYIIELPIILDLKGLFYSFYLQDYENSEVEIKKKYLFLFGLTSDLLYNLFNFMIYNGFLTNHNTIKTYIEDFEALTQFVDQDMTLEMKDDIDFLLISHSKRMYLLLFKLIHETCNRQFDRKILFLVQEILEYKEILYDPIEIPFYNFDNRYKPSTVYRFDLNYEYFYVLLSLLMNNQNIIFKENLENDNFNQYRINKLEQILREFQKIIDNKIYIIFEEINENTDEWIEKFRKVITKYIQSLKIKSDEKINKAKISQAKIDLISREIEKNLKILPFSNKELNKNYKDYDLKFKVQVTKDYLIEGLEYLDLITPELGKMASDYLFGHLLNQLPSEPTIFFKNRELYEQHLETKDIIIFIPRNIFSLYINNFALNFDNSNPDKFYDFLYFFKNRFKTSIKLINFPLYPIGIYASEYIDGMIDHKSIKVDFEEEDLQNKEVELTISVKCKVISNIKKFRIIFGNYSDA